MQFQNKLVVLSTSRAIREYINSFVATDVLLPKIITIGDFFSFCIYSNLKFATEDIRLYFLKQSIKENYYPKLGILSNYNSFIKQSDYLFKFFEELSNELVDIKTLHTHDTYALYEDHLNILEDILRTYISLLEQNGFIDKILLPSRYILNEEYIKQFSEIEIVIDGYLTNFEFQIINQISELTTLYLQLFASKYNEKNLQKFKFIHSAFKTNHTYFIDLTNNIVIGEEKVPNQSQDLAIYNFSTRHKQIDFINYSIYKMINDDIATNKICVVLPDENFATDLLLYDEAKNLNFAMGLSIVNSHFFKKLQALYEALSDLEPKSIQKLKYFHIQDSFFQFLKDYKQNKIDSEIIVQLQDFILEEIEGEIKNKIDAEFYFLENIIKIGIEFSVIEFIKLLIEKISQIKIDYVGGGEVTVLGILETRGVQFDGVIVVDFNEKQLPKLSVKDKYLSSNVKKFSNLPTAHDRKNLQKYYYDRLFKRAKKVLISYVENDQEAISIFALELFGKTKLQNTLKKITFDNNKKALEFGNFDEQIIMDIDLSKLSWSAYKLKDYLECKRRFYIKNILNIKEPQNKLYDVSKKDIGSIVHKVLELTFANSYYFDDVNKLFFAIKQNLNIFKKQNPNLVFELCIWEQKLYDFALNEINRFNQGTFVYELEKRFSCEISNVKFTGVIDRIDKLSDGKYLICDYKTSSAIKINDECDFQLEIYFMAQKELNPLLYIYDLQNAKMIQKQNIEENLTRLSGILDTLHTEKVDFQKTDKLKDCQFCPYKIMCGRDF